MDFDTSLAEYSSSLWAAPWVDETSEAKSSRSLSIFCRSVSIKIPVTKKFFNMYLQYSLDVSGNRVYSLKVSDIRCDDDDEGDDILFTYHKKCLYCRKRRATEKQPFQPILPDFLPMTSIHDTELPSRSASICSKISIEERTGHQQ